MYFINSPVYKIILKHIIELLQVVNHFNNSCEWKKKDVVWNAFWIYNPAGEQSSKSFF